MEMRTLCLCCIAVSCLAQAPKFEPGEGWKPLFNGKSLDGWRASDPAKPNVWQTAQSVAVDGVDPKLFHVTPLAGARGVMVNGKAGKTVNLVSSESHGDVEAYLEFAVPYGSNSGVYFQGLYEIQVLDSWGKTELAYSDCGGVYGRFINGKTVGGVPPRVNASRPPGVWQSFHVWFRAPRFDSRGKKTENARFVKVIHNGVVIHENIDLEGPTRAAMSAPESSSGPLMLQGDHGPVAYRNLYVRSLRGVE